jgi:hypothetical protein
MLPVGEPRGNPPHGKGGGYAPAQASGANTLASALERISIAFVNDVQQTSIVDIDLIPGDPEVLRKFNLTNFPNGLPAGTYTFTGQFFDDGQLVLTRTSIVHFT